MAYFTDLAPYAYGHHPHPGVVHVGWLDGTHAFPKGKVDPALVEKLKLLAERPVELYRGLHFCELCKAPPDLSKTFLPRNPRVIEPDCAWAKWFKQRTSNGEIRLQGEGVIFAAPLLIIHNIEVHGYLPPLQFLDALKDAVC